LLALLIIFVAGFAPPAGEILRADHDPANKDFKQHISGIPKPGPEWEALFQDRCCFSIP
jgi:hypothetical protein